MTGDVVFTPVPPDLYRRVEKAAGVILPPLTGRLRAARPNEQFWPNWAYLLSEQASVDAVVAGLCCGAGLVPETAWRPLVQRHCPLAWRMLADARMSFAAWHAGRCPAPLWSTVAAQANHELHGYAVFLPWEDR